MAASDPNFVETVQITKLIVSNQLECIPLNSSAQRDLNDYCDLCGKSFKKAILCEQCHKVRYCSIDCQLKQWPIHRKICLIQITIDNYLSYFRSQEEYFYRLGYLFISPPPVSTVRELGRQSRAIQTRLEKNPDSTLNSSQNTGNRSKLRNSFDSNVYSPITQLINLDANLQSTFSSQFQSASSSPSSSSSPNQSLSPNLNPGSKSQSSLQVNQAVPQERCAELTRRIIKETIILLLDDKVVFEEKVIDNQIMVLMRVNYPAYLSLSSELADQLSEDDMQHNLDKPTHLKDKTETNCTSNQSSYIEKYDNQNNSRLKLDKGTEQLEKMRLQYLTDIFDILMSLKFQRLLHWALLNGINGIFVKKYGHTLIYQNSEGWIFYNYQLDLLSTKLREDSKSILL